MAIIQQQVNLNNQNLIYTYSDEGRYIVRDEIEYVEAYDPASAGRQYTEGRLIEDDSQAMNFLNIILGEDNQ